MTTKTLTVTGMHCPKCTARVEKAVGALDGFEDDRVDVAYDGAAETLAAVKSAIVAEDFVVED